MTAPTWAVMCPRDITGGTPESHSLDSAGLGGSWGAAPIWAVLFSRDSTGGTPMSHSLKLAHLGGSLTADWPSVYILEAVGRDRDPEGSVGGQLVPSMASGIYTSKLAGLILCTFYVVKKDPQNITFFYICEKSFYVPGNDTIFFILALLSTWGRSNGVLILLFFPSFLTQA